MAVSVKSTIDIYHIHMSRGRLGILVGGGPAPGINGVIAAATIEGINQGYEVIGFYDGFKWLAAGEAQHCRPLAIRDVSGIHLRGGSILGTSRTNPTDEQLETIIRHIKGMDLFALVAVGGDDTLSVASRLHKRGVPVIGVPKMSCSRLADDLTVAVTGSPGATAAHEAGHLIY